MQSKEIPFENSDSINALNVLIIVHHSNFLFHHGLK